ncbi:carboxypeptidase-like regulatory domain-containing protein [Lutibacter sp.]|uniref:carboxypeptidase-like regulatory domain-containing protein n=1 Tax=Lutibacter sp. TaxID=1925666 RepID=UPI003567BEC7
MKFFWFVILVISSTLVYSQSFEVESFFSDSHKQGGIEGVVFDNETNNEPLLFATVAIKNTTVSTTTELDGSFSLNLKPGSYTLVYSFVGYKTIEVENVIVTSNKTTSNNQTLSALEASFDISSID